MSLKIVSWVLLSAISLGLIVLFNYWAAYQLLSTLVYAGIVAAIFGLANLVIPFRFLGFHKRLSGALILASGIALTLTALFWKAPTFRVTQPKSRLDEVMPEYQFWEKHSARVHARPEQVMQAVRQSTFGDLRSLATLLRIRSAAMRSPPNNSGTVAADKQVLPAFSASGYASGGSEREIVMCGGANLRAQRPLRPHTLQECADEREPGVMKVAFNFTAEDAGSGWSEVSTETRILATDDLSSRGAARYWRLIVPGSGMLRRQWLDGIKRRAESATGQ